MSGKFVKGEYISKIISTLECELDEIQVIINEPMAENEPNPDSYHNSMRALFARQTELKAMIKYLKK